MTEEVRASAHSPSHRRFQFRWRWGVGVAFAVAGGLFATTALNADGTDLRAASVTDLNQFVRQERARSDDLAKRLEEINREVNRLSRTVDDRQVSAVQREVDALRSPAGFRGASGPGLTVVLDDAPKEDIDAASEAGGVTPDELIVHQQDIQAVVNALWSGGAEAMTIQGQRVISTTGIKCVGNTVVLHGVPYSPPYRISAIGDAALLQAALETNEYVQAYRSFVVNYNLGFEVRVESRLRMPAYTGSATLTYAKQIGTPSGVPDDAGR